MQGDFSHFLSRLEGVKPYRGGWIARCPAHDDRRPSLSIFLADDTGDLLLRCYAGCTFQQIIDAAGVDKQSLLAERPGRRFMQEVAAYPYQDERGELLYEVVRFEPKDFRCRRWVDGQALWGLEGCRRVLYQLPSVVARGPRTTLLVEGEKSADRLASLGFIATCSPGGAGKWRDEYCHFFAPGDRVVCLPDNDEPGVQHMIDAHDSLKLAGMLVATVELDVPHKGDPWDWLEAGHTAEELKELCAYALRAERILGELLGLGARDRWRIVRAAFASLEPKRA